MEASCYIDSTGAPSFRAELVSRNEIVLGRVFSVTFKAESEDPIDGVQSHYCELDMIGRHFLINETKRAKKRHYTICNCMEKNMYKEYIRVLESFCNGKPVKTFKKELLREAYSKFVNITLKDY